MTAVVEASLRPFSLSTYEGWRAFVAREHERPRAMTMQELAAMSDRERYVHDRQRAEWHSNMGTYLHPRMLKVIDGIDTIVRANCQDGDKVRTSPVLDAPPGLGKSTLALHLGKKFHLEQIKYLGEKTASGNDRIPVLYLTLSGRTTIKSFAWQMCNFYNDPAAGRANAIQLAKRAAEGALACETELIIIDDVHFLNPCYRDFRDVANQFKAIANEYQATIFYCGVDLDALGLFTEGRGPGAILTAQMARRCTRFTLDPFEINSKEGKEIWHALLLRYDERVVLARKYQGMIAEDLAPYLYTRSGGHFASLSALIERGCMKAIKSGDERLTMKMLESLPLDAAAEAQRVSTESKVRLANKKRYRASR